MRNIKQKDAALSAFIAKKATIDAVLARLAGLNADHLRAFGRCSEQGDRCRTRISPKVGEPTLCGRVQLASAIVQHLLCSLEQLEIADRRPIGFSEGLFTAGRVDSEHVDMISLAHRPLCGSSSRKRQRMSREPRRDLAHRDNR